MTSADTAVMVVVVYNQTIAGLSSGASKIYIYIFYLAFYMPTLSAFTCTDADHNPIMVFI